MQYLHPISWTDVFDTWKISESKNPHWIQVAKEKGFSDWETWRLHAANRIHATERSWSLYSFTDPLHEIPSMRIGPFTSWQNLFKEKNIHTFQELLDIPGQEDKWRSHSHVTSLQKALPFDMTLIGFLIQDTDQIICLEGHHRATAVTLAAKEKKVIDFSTTNIHIALTPLENSELGILNELLAAGPSQQHTI